MPTAFEVADTARAKIADLLDLQLSPLGLAAIDELSVASGQSVLDVGCGTGQTISQLAEYVGPSGHIFGVDIGPRSLAVARSRTAHLSNTTLMQQDAASLDLPDQHLDAVYSRFGVMFFDDPVAAFSNFRRMLKPSGQIAFVCWRALQENELDLLPLKAAALNIETDGTPFSFERRDTIHRVLSDAGFENSAVRKFDAAVSCGGINDALKVLTTVGALGKVLRDNPALIDKARPRVLAALSTRTKNGAVKLEAATWIVSATKA